jgi:dTDP-glucose 4,6-dehydratase
MRPDDGRAIPTFVRQALEGEPLTVTGDGTQTRSLCYVDDLVSGLMQMMAGDHGGPVNLGTPHEVTMLDLARWIIELTGSSSRIQLVPRPQDDPEKRRPDITLARDLLGWEPKTAVEQGLRETIASLSKQLSQGALAGRGAAAPASAHEPALTVGAHS